MIQRIIYFCAVISLLISFSWGNPENQILEPWLAFLSGILFILGALIQGKKLKSLNFQSSIFAIFSKAKIKNPRGNNKQFNIFGINNSQEIEYSSLLSENKFAEYPKTERDYTKLNSPVFQGVKEAIKDGDTEKAIDNLSSIINRDYPAAYKELLGLQAQLSHLEYERRQMLISGESYRANRQRLNHGIIDLVENLAALG